MPNELCSFLCLPQQALGLTTWGKVIPSWWEAAEQDEEESGSEAAAGQAGKGCDGRPSQPLSPQAFSQLVACLLGLCDLDAGLLRELLERSYLAGVVKVLLAGGPCVVLWCGVKKERRPTRTTAAGAALKDFGGAKKTQESCVQRQAGACAKKEDAQDTGGGKGHQTAGARTRTHEERSPASKTPIRKKKERGVQVQVQV